MINASRPDMPKGSSDVSIVLPEGESEAEALARVVMGPGIRHAAIARAFAEGSLNPGSVPDLSEAVAHLSALMDQAQTGDTTNAARILTAQAATLDAMFVELARRAILNLAEFPEAADRYMRLALKAQDRCRGTLEALAAMNQTREHRHVHVADGGQALIADEFHHYVGEPPNGKSAEPPHEAPAAYPRPSSAMRREGQEPSGRPMPSPGSARPNPLPGARLR